MKMKKSLLLLVIFFSLFGSLRAQIWKDSLDVTVYGYVKLDAFLDTRETVNGREGHFLLWPTKPVFDDDGNDINAHTCFNMLAVQSNFGIKVTGPEIFKAKSQAKIEGDFFGQLNDNVNLIRLRHAFFQLDWKHSNLLIGQYWNPVFNLGAFPNTVSFTTGTPILPFSRNPQVRYTQILKNFAIIGVVQSQRDYPSFGPTSNQGSSVPDSKFLRNAGMPEFHAKITYAKLSENFDIRAGVGAGYKQIMPRTSTLTGYATHQKVPGMSASAYLNCRLRIWTFKTGIIYGNNATDVMSLGGFAVHSVTDSIRDFYEYTTLASYSIWSELSIQVHKFNIGVFGGRVTNLGSDKTINGQVWGLGNDIAYIYRISPRVYYQQKAFRVAFELEHTVASFGEMNDFGVPKNGEEVANTRFLLGVYYFFN
jgi:hypothetical protein